MSKEKFKTALLAMLVVLSIALTQKLWMSVPTVAMIPSLKGTDIQFRQKQSNEAINISDVISPQSFTINFGGVNHTVLFSDSYEIWKEVMLILKGYFEDGVTVEEITPERWGDINAVRAIIVNFDYSMPVGILQKMVKGKEAGLYSKVSAMSSLLVPISEDGIIYISDSANGKLYQARGHVIKEKIGQIITEIEEENIAHELKFKIPKYDYYYSIKSLFAVDNPVLIPLDISKGVSEIKVENEINISDLKQVDMYASTFFGENFDFVKKIIETNGSVIYMYGYGRKVLKVDGTGGFEYTEEAEDTKASSHVELGESIQAAVQFVISHGMIPGSNVYLKDIRPIHNGDEKKAGYQLFFTNRVNGLPVYMKDNPTQMPLEVKVFGNQVTYYKRLLTREKIDISFIDNVENLPILLTPQEALDKNLNTIKSDLNITSDQSIAFNEVLSNVKMIELCYYSVSNGEGNKLIPVWKLQLEKDTYFFDGYTGSIISRLNTKER